MRKRTGRRPGVSGSRQAIIDAARAKFAERGYEGATVRAIADDAGVDAALIHHFFETKEGLFAAATREAFDARAIVPNVADGGVDGAGERLVRAFLDLSETTPARQMLIGIVRSAVSHPDAVRLLRGIVGSDLLGRVTKALQVDQPELRAGLVGSQLVGLLVTRDIVGVRQLGSFEREQLVATVAPVVQHYLEDDLPSGAKAPRRRAAKRGR